MPVDPTDIVDLAHIGMLNPPRKAKRLRELVAREHVAEHEPETRAIAVATASSDDQPQPGPRRRGRKPAGPTSRAAREQLRKTNHSVIEKRRREKINDALAALRELVPGAEEPEKEFKLEVLVRTVEYLRAMVDKVQTLQCSRCGDALEAPAPGGVPKADPPAPVTGKRKRALHEDAALDAELLPADADADDRACYRRPTEPPSSGLHSPVSPSVFPRLPPISSWMLPPSPVSLPATSPLYPVTSPRHALQLPSPPGGDAPLDLSPFPRLSLPPRMPPFDPPRRHWSRDDQTAASLLLSISTRRGGERGVEAQTPRSVLGME